MWAAIGKVVALDDVVLHCRAVGQNAPHNFPPHLQDPTPTLGHRLKCGLASVFVQLIFEGVRLISVG